ncbi:B-cell receptor CD22-like isoform X1 [Pygocentrus nattereri]|uniref:B-cell receptor CD22-like isoform X1 n=1 Tax=Pygocentrus nattereri TaxID=42514 RepID=UPI001891E772|nr:B-cell receptor CD22-like isoform X1 [Pygocentrus nattereri]XP_037399351.1 B-cell receptor CD22-like isoform X1 [Pygocentrus nattereri]
MTSLRVPLSFPLLCLLMIVGTFGTEWSVKYNQQEICALKGSTVFMNGTFTHPEGLTVTEKFWVIDPALNPSWPDMSQNPDYSGRVEYLGDEQKLVSLKLRDVMKKDEHEYCVRIKTDQEMQKYLQRPGVRLTVTELHVEAPEEVTEGQTADLTCKTTCSLTDPFIWYKNGHPLTTKTIKNNQLHLQTVSSEDAGSYSCAVGGSQHLHSTAHSLRVRYPPKSVSVSISPSGEIVEGSSVTLTCSSDGNPPVKIYTWFKGSTPVGEGKNYSIPNIRSEDSGEYRCQSWNDHGQRISTAVHLNVLYPPKRVSVSISPSGEIVEDSSVTLTCSSDANPPEKNNTWFKGSTPVGEGKNYSIPNIRSDDSGEYRCKSRNDLGERRSTAVQINVLYPPKNVSVSISPSGEIVEGSSVTLTCSSDGNPPVKNYTWFKEGGTSPVGSGQNYIIINITADHTGLYYCEAQNDHGALRSAGVPVSFKGYPVILYVALGVGLCFIFLVVLTAVFWRCSESRRKRQDGNTDQPIYANEGQKDHSPRPPPEDKSSVYANVAVFKKQR